MAISIVGSTYGTIDDKGMQTIPVPAGAMPGDIAILSLPYLPRAFNFDSDNKGIYSSISAWQWLWGDPQMRVNFLYSKVEQGIQMQLSAMILTGRNQYLQSGWAPFKLDMWHNGNLHTDIASLTVIRGATRRLYELKVYPYKDEARTILVNPNSAYAQVQYVVDGLYVTGKVAPSNGQVAIPPPTVPGRLGVVVEVPAAFNATSFDNWHELEEDISAGTTMWPVLPSGKKITFNWDPVTDATSYQVVIRHNRIGGSLADRVTYYLAEDGTLSTSVVNLSNMTTSRTVTLDKDGYYEWYVNANRSVGVMKSSKELPLAQFDPGAAPDVYNMDAVLSNSTRPEVNYSPGAWGRTPDLVPKQGRVTIKGPGVDYTEVYDIPSWTSGQMLTWKPEKAVPGAWESGATYQFTLELLMSPTSTIYAWSPAREFTWKFEVTQFGPPSVTAAEAADLTTRIEANTSPGSRVEVEALVDGRWVPRFPSEVTDADGHVAITDPLAVWGMNTYRARRYAALDGLPVASRWSDPFMAENRDPRNYLVFADDPTDYVEVIISAEKSRIYPNPGAVHEPLNGYYNIFEYGPVRAMRGGMTVTTFRRTDTDRLVSILRSHKKLYLRMGPDTTVDLGFLDHDVQDIVKFEVEPGQVEVTRKIDSRAQPWRVISFDWREAE